MVSQRRPRPRTPPPLDLSAPPPISWMTLPPAQQRRLLHVLCAIALQCLRAREVAPRDEVVDERR